MSDAEVICSRRGVAGEIWLNRPKALNALNLSMVRLMTSALEAWALDPDIERVVIRGTGERAFCAGGDIRLLHDQGKAGDFVAQRMFWREEYELNRLIHRYPKPYVALIDGIVMGGGAGVSIHGSHRIVGDRTMFAMPEVGIGFFPDVGASWFLPRLPGETGTYLALTGARIGAGDAVDLGLAQAYVRSARFNELAEALTQSGETTGILVRFADHAPAPTLPRALIDQAFSGNEIRAIRDDLDGLARTDGEAGDLARDWQKTLSSRSPTSLCLALRQMREGCQLDIEAVMQMEYRILSRIVRGSDFYEGVRAVLIDKDNSPIWNPARLDDIDPAQIDAHFSPLDDDLEFSTINADATV